MCDVDPMPWGDGAVDEADPEVLMEHWGESYPVIVDDFESYDGAYEMGTTIWHTWSDGSAIITSNGTDDECGIGKQPIAVVRWSP